MVMSAFIKALRATGGGGGTVGPEVTERSSGTHKREVQREVTATSNENSELKFASRRVKIISLAAQSGEFLVFVPAPSTLRTPPVPLCVRSGRPVTSGQEYQHAGEPVAEEPEIQQRQGEQQADQDDVHEGGSLLKVGYATRASDKCASRA